MANYIKSKIAMMWSIAGFIVYFGICVFDFVLMPYYTGLLVDDYNDELNLVSDIALLQIDPIMSAYTEHAEVKDWEPITLQSYGIFHIAFISILSCVILVHRGINILHFIDSDDPDIQ